MLNDVFMEMLDMQEYSIKKVELKKDQLHLWVDLKEKVFHCPRCNQLSFSTYDHWDIILKERPVLERKTHIHIPHYRIYCTCQDKPLTADIVIKEPGFMVTRGFARALIKDAKDVPLSFVCRKNDLHWNTARDIDLAYLTKRIDKIKTVSPWCISVDEFSYGKGHTYLSLVTDLDRHRLVFATKGRKSKNLNTFFETRMNEGAQKKLKAASIDMWDPYEKSIKHYAPQAAIVYDKFHIIRTLNNGIDTVRREQQQQLEEEDRRILKRKRFLLLKGQERLEPEQQQTLQELLDQNQPLHTAYLLKEQFRQLYEIDYDTDEPPDKVFKRAFMFLIGWLQRAMKSNLKPFLKFCECVKKRWYGILNYFRYRITNGLSESLNNKIASLTKRACGYRNLEYFILKIYQQGNLI